MSEFNAYQEAKSHFEELLNNYEGSGKADITFSELISEDEHETEYCFSVYNSTLFQAIAEDLSILGYAEDVEKEFGQGIATNPLMINEAIFQYLQDEYGEKTASYFDIEVEEEEEEESEEEETEEEEEEQQ